MDAHGHDNSRFSDGDSDSPTDGDYPSAYE